jgi:hypothetical protein
MLQKLITLMEIIRFPKFLCEIRQTTFTFIATFCRYTTTNPYIKQAH